MGYTINSIVIKKEINELFLIINNLENWPKLHGYQSAELIEQKKLIDGKLKIVFKITGEEEENDKGEKYRETWVSQRIIDISTYSARGVRIEPMYPFKYWILDITLSKEKDGTRMTWTQDFTMDKKSGHTDDEIEEWINRGSKKELQVFKEEIESGEIHKKFDFI